jgi:S-formylglutathione hydrolase FrmB
MAFFDFHFFSESLGLNCSAHVVVPQQTTRQIGMIGGERREKYPTLYLLHGLSDDHTIWMRRTSIERYATERNLAVVMPAVARSFYQDMASGPKYWTFVSEELPALCEQFFPLAAERAQRFAAGLSMGGYGALRLGLARPERYAAVACLSGALDVARRLREAGREGSLVNQAEYTGMFGPGLQGAGTEVDLYFLAQKLAASSQPRPALFLACGTEDRLLGEQRDFQQHLARVGLAATCEESPGDHEWGYWDAQIRRVLAWLPLSN